MNNTNELPHNHGEPLEDILNHMPNINDFDNVATIFQTLCDSSRLRILWILCHREECGINIAALVNMSPAAVSHHLKNLKLSGLITSRREGKEVYYKLAKTEKAILVHRVIDELFQVTCPNNNID